MTSPEEKFPIAVLTSGGDIRYPEESNEFGPRFKVNPMADSTTNYKYLPKGWLLLFSKVDIGIAKRTLETINRK